MSVLVWFGLNCDSGFTRLTVEPRRSNENSRRQLTAVGKIRRQMSTSPAKFILCLCQIYMLGFGSLGNEE